MDRTLILKISLSTAFVCIMLGLVAKILHYSYRLNTIMVGIIAALLFTAIALFEVWSSKQVMITEKFMWTTGFIIMPGLTGILYLFTARKRILRLSHY
ncbi:MAG TPA: hypothetical protein VLZ28_04145 [Daejeonella sp.]|nr:hypothetical protein [Daejeonella sp.]